MNRLSLAERLTVDGVALCVIDVQVDFGAPNGALARMGVDVGQVASAVDNAARLAQAARSAGVPIFFVGLKTEPATDSSVWREWMDYRGLSAETACAICRAGSGGESFYKLAPRPDEQVVWKRRYSAFVDTDFNERLRGERIHTLVLCGLTTECCVDSTARDAFQRDLLVVVAGDACGAYREDFHRYTLDMLTENFALVLSTDNIVGQWNTRTERGS
jgi:nicotinamidase-related amidase